MCSVGCRMQCNNNVMYTVSVLASNPGPPSLCAKDKDRYNMGLRRAWLKPSVLYAQYKVLYIWSKHVPCSVSGTVFVRSVKQSFVQGYHFTQVYRTKCYTQKLQHAAFYVPCLSPCCFKNTIYEKLVNSKSTCKLGTLNSSQMAPHCHTTDIPCVYFTSDPEHVMIIDTMFVSLLAIQLNLHMSCKTILMKIF